MEQYAIGNLLFAWDGGGYTLGTGEYMERFRHSGEADGDTVSFRATFEPLERYTAFPKLLERELYSVYDVHGEKLILYNWAYLRNAYGIWPDRIAAGREDVCSFDPAIRQQPPLPADWFFGVCGLQKALLLRDMPVLHGAYIDYRGKAILFLAPSGTGKSTQAELWRRYAGARIINGDRVLLYKDAGKWYACGYPNCGSSDICENRTLPLRAIVILQQSPRNEVLKMPLGEKLRHVAAGICVYHWDPADLEKSFQLAGELAAGTEIVRLSCRPDREAVEVLRQYLEE